MPTSERDSRIAAGPTRGSLEALRAGNRDALARGVSRYVRDGVGGSRRAARRMGEARASAGRLLGVVRDFGRDGPAEALRVTGTPAAASASARAAASGGASDPSTIVSGAGCGPLGGV